MSPDELASLMRCSGCGRRPEELDEYLEDTIVIFAPEPPEDLPAARYGEFVLAHWRAASDYERVAAIRRWALNREPTLNYKTGAFACRVCWIIGGMPVRGSSNTGDARGSWSVPDGGEWPNLKQVFLEHAGFLRMQVPKNREDESHVDSARSHPQ